MRIMGIDYGEKRKDRVDMIAAQLILQGYLDRIKK